MRHLQKIRETDAGPIDFHWFHNFFRYLIFEFFFFNNADVVTIKDDSMRHLNIFFDFPQVLMLLKPKYLLS